MTRDMRCKKWTLSVVALVGFCYIVLQVTAPDIPDDSQDELQIVDLSIEAQREQSYFKDNAYYGEQIAKKDNTEHKNNNRKAKDTPEKSKLPTQPSECPQSGLGPTHAANLRKIDSYKFTEAEPYLSDLFSSPIVKRDAKSLPVLVTAVSSSHVDEAMLLFDNINKVLRPKYPNIALYLYDIGLTKGERFKIKNTCQCLIRRFPFDDYPTHVSYLKGYAWKPIIVQLVSKEFRFIMWLDTSPRFTKGNLDFLFDRARKNGILATRGYNSIASRTHAETFKFLQEDPCIYGEIVQMQACFIVFYINDFVRNYFLKPWVGCALSPGCTVPSGDPYHHLECLDGKNKENKDQFHLCHRFDQSVMNILMYRMFNKTFDQHTMKFDFYQIKRQGSNLV